MTPDNLARFARLSQQAKLREEQQREAEQAELKAEQAKQRADALERGRARREQLGAEGPPNGCHACYVLRESYPWTGEFWTWHHGEDINPEMRPLIFFWEDADDPGEVVPVCTHECHGPEGCWTPLVAYA